MKNSIADPVPGYMLVSDTLAAMAKVETEPGTEGNAAPVRRARAVIAVTGSAVRARRMSGFAMMAVNLFGETVGPVMGARVTVKLHGVKDPSEMLELANVMPFASGAAVLDPYIELGQVEPMKDGRTIEVEATWMAAAAPPIVRFCFHGIAQVEQTMLISRRKTEEGSRAKG